MKETPTLCQLGALISQQISPEDISEEAWHEIMSAALQHGLAPMLLWVAKQNAPEIVTEPLWTPIITATRGTGLRFVSLEAARKQVDMALDAAQIPALWLKGIALAHSVYPQPTLRPMSDLDVLIPYDQQLAAIRALESAGHLSLDKNSVLDRDQDARLAEKMIRYNNKFVIGTSNPVNLELHYRLLSTDDVLLPREKLPLFWSQTEFLDGLLVLQPEANLLYLCAHCVLQHGLEDFRLLRFWDIHQLIVSTGLDWKKVVEQAIGLKWTYGVEQALQLSISYFKTPVPKDVLAELKSRRPADDYVPHPRFKGKGSRWRNALVSLDKLSTREKVLVIRKICFPSREYMRVRYSIRPNVPVWPYYLYRWFDQGSELFWAMWSRSTHAIGIRK
jgi:hypothetical protein